MADIINKINDKVQIIFEKGTSEQQFRDAIWMTQEEYDNTSSDTIESIKQQRYDDWLAIINAMPVDAGTNP